MTWSRPGPRELTPLVLEKWGKGLWAALFHRWGPGAQRGAQAPMPIPRWKGQKPREHICESWRQPRPFLAIPPHPAYPICPIPGLQDPALALVPSWALAFSPDREAVHISLSWGSTDKPSPPPAPPSPPWTPSIRMQFPPGALECQCSKGGHNPFFTDETWGSE